MKTPLRKKFSQQNHLFNAVFVESNSVVVKLNAANNPKYAVLTILCMLLIVFFFLLSSAEVPGHEGGSSKEASSAACHVQLGVGSKLNLRRLALIERSDGNQQISAEWLHHSFLN